MYGGANWGDRSGGDPNGSSPAIDRDATLPFPQWVGEAQKSAAQAEWSKLTAIGTAPNYLTTQVLARAKQSPQDALVPQALFLAVRATHYGCTNAETSTLSKAAFEFLHKHYPESEWATKTKYYY
jgi:hypothetical protein